MYGLKNQPLYFLDFDTYLGDDTCPTEEVNVLWNQIAEIRKIDNVLEVFCRNFVGPGGGNPQLCVVASPDHIQVIAKKMEELYGYVDLEAIVKQDLTKTPL